MLELIEVLVEYGADVDAMDKRGEAPLHYASRSGNVDTAWFLMVNGATVDSDPTCREQTPLHVAAACGHAELASMLLKEGGAEPLAIDAQGRTSIQVAVAAGRQRQMAQVLSDRSVSRKSGGTSCAEPQKAKPVHKRDCAASSPEARVASSTRTMNDQNAFKALWG